MFTSEAYENVSARKGRFSFLFTCLQCFHVLHLQLRLRYCLRLRRTSKPGFYFLSIAPDWPSTRVHILVGFLILFTTTNAATASERLTFNVSCLFKKMQGNRMLNKTAKKFFRSRRLVVSAISFTPLQLL